MRKLRLLSALMFLLIGALGFVSCNDDDDDPQPSQDIVQILSDDADYSLLVEAVEKAGLANVLNNAGPFTLFAPDNDALEAFLTAAGTNTIANTPAEVLEEVLLTHVLGGSVTSGQLNTGYTNTLNPADVDESVFTTIFFEVDGGGITINGDAMVTNADISANNGVIHQIDKVIAPPTVVTFALADDNFDLLVEALTLSGLPTDFVSTLNGAGPFTVFAPTNQAFQALLDSNGSWNSLADIPADLLDTVLKYHVASGANVRSSDIVNGQEINTLAGESFTIQTGAGNVILEAAQNTANVIFTDVQAENGVIHVIDTVLLPE